jgi:tape measure domain-containing protein
MANPELKIKISAETGDAVQGINAVDGSLDTLAKGSGAAEAGLKRAGDAARKAGDDANHAAGAFGSMQGALNKINAGLKPLTDLSNSINEIGQAAGTVLGPMKSMIDLGDEYDALAARVRLVADAQTGAAGAMRELEAIALRTHAPLADMGNLFLNLANAMKGTGRSTQEILGVTEALGNAIRVSGVNGQAASAALTQLGQAMSEGALRGDNFNSVAEQMPVVLDAIVAYTGYSRDSLREMAEQGKLTADIINASVNSMAKSWAEQAASMPVSLNQAITDLNTAWQSYLGQSQAVGTASQTLSSLLQTLAQNIDTVANAAITLGEYLIAAFAVKGALALRALAAEAIVAAGTMKTLGAAAETVGLSFSKIGAIITRVGWAAVAVEVFNLTKNLYELYKQNQEIAKLEQDAASSKERLAQKLREVSAATGIQITSMQQLIQLEKEGVIWQNQATGQWERVTEATREAAAAHLAAKENMAEAAKAAQGVKGELAKLEGQYDLLAATVDAVTGVALANADANVAAADAAAQQAEIMADLTGAYDDQVAAAEAATEAAEARTDAAWAQVEADEAEARAAQEKYDDLIEQYKKLTAAGIPLTQEQQKLKTETWAAAESAKAQAAASASQAAALGAVESASRVAALTLGDQSDQVNTLELAYVRAKGAAEAAAAQFEKYTQQQAEMARLSEELKRTQEELAAATDKTSLSYVDLKARESELIQEQALLNQSMEKNKITQEEVNAKVGEAKEKQAQYRDATNDSIKALNFEIDALGRKQKLSDQVFDIQQESLRQQADMAEKQGDVARATELRVQAQKQEADQLRVSAALEQQKAEKLALVAAETERLAMEDGKLTTEEQAAIAAAQDAAKAAELEAQGRSQAANAAEMQADAIEAAAAAAEEEKKAKEEAAEAAAEAAAQAARENTVYTTSIETWIARAGVAKDKIDEVAAAYKDLAQAARGAGRAFATPEEMESAINGLIAQAKAIVAARDAMEELTERVDSGTLSMEELEQATWAANNMAGVLGDEELEGLRDAIQSAKDDMQDFTDDAKEGLRDLQQEWLEIQGNDFAAAQMEQQQQRIEIEEQLAEARRQGNQEAIDALLEQLEILDKIHADELQRIQDEQASAIRAATTVEELRIAYAKERADLEAALQAAKEAGDDEAVKAIQAQIKALEGVRLETERGIRAAESATAAEKARQQAIEAQQKAVADLTERLGSTEVSWLDIAEAERQVAALAGKIGAEDLDGLRGAIADAKQRIVDFAEASRQSLVGLQQEWNSLYGDEIANTRIQEAEKILDLERKIAEAKAANNQQAVDEYTKQLDLAQKLSDARIRMAEKERDLEFIRMAQTSQMELNRLNERSEVENLLIEKSIALYDTQVKLNNARAIGDKEAVFAYKDQLGWLTKIYDKKIEEADLEERREKELERLDAWADKLNAVTVSYDDIAAATQYAARAARVLGEEDLATLNSAIDSARKKLDDLANSAQAGLDALERQLLQLQGKQEDILKFDYDKDRKKIEEDLQAAIAAGNKDAEDALRKQLDIRKKIFDTERGRIKTEIDGEKEKTDLVLDRISAEDEQLKKEAEAVQSMEAARTEETKNRFRMEETAGAQSFSLAKRETDETKQQTLAKTESADYSLESAQRETKEAEKQAAIEQGVLDPVTSSPVASTTPTQNTNGPTKTVVLKLGRATITAVDDGGTEGFLRELERSGLVSQ